MNYFPTPRSLPSECTNSTDLCIISAADCTDHKSQGADTILCIDTSGSMDGQKFEQIKAFIESFIEGYLFFLVYRRNEANFENEF
jgi:hypothetical protein